VLEADIDVEAVTLLAGVTDADEVREIEAAGELLGIGDSEAAPLPQIIGKTLPPVPQSCQVEATVLPGLYMVTVVSLSWGWPASHAI